MGFRGIPCEILWDFLRDSVEFPWVSGGFPVGSCGISYGFLWEWDEN